MRIVFSLDFDGSAWPGPLATRDAAFGEAWVGRAGLLDVLETALGLGGPRLSKSLRAAGLVPRIRQTAGFWSASAEVDPFGVATVLAAWRDVLWLHGWRGQAVSARLAQLAAVTGDLKQGEADRLAVVVQVLARRDAGIEAVELLEPREELPIGWRALLDALETRGTRIVARELPIAPARGDLAAARSAGFVPKADGTLTLVRPLSSTEAAEAVAAWLASADGAASTVVVAPDSVLDASLRRHGLPCTGAAAPNRDNVLLQLLPLVLALGWDPPDPRRALELLTIDPSPVPRAITRKLVGALSAWPAVGSDLWQSALADGLGRIEEAERRARVAARLDVLLRPAVDRRADAYPAREVHRRVDALVAWLRGRLEMAAEPGLVWMSALAQCKAFLELVDALGMDSFRDSELAQLVANANDSALAIAAFPAEAGFAAVSAPGAVAGPAERVVWWAFTATAAHAPERLPFTPNERAGLATLGAPLPDPGREAIGLARRWRRPLHQATGELVLVAPLRDEVNEEAYTHPLWDEIEAALAKGEKSTVLVRREPIPRGAPPRRSGRVFRALPTARETWAADAARVVARDFESASSVADLAGCSFKWAVRHSGRLYPGLAAALPGAARLDGSLVHEIVARALHPDAGAPSEAPALAARLFDTEAPRLASELFLPGADARRARLKAISVRAVTRLLAILGEAGLVVAAVEEERAGGGALGSMKGRIDLVAGPRPVVIDLKLGGESWRRKSLAAGTAHQLAVYADLVRGEANEWPPVAFFVLERQRLLTTATGVFPSVPEVEGPGAEHTFQALAAAVASRRRELAAGRIVAPANGPARIEKDEVVGGELKLKAPCDWCDYGLLCGATFGAPSP